MRRNIRVKRHVRKDGTVVRGHTRNIQRVQRQRKLSRGARKARERDEKDLAHATKQVDEMESELAQIHKSRPIQEKSLADAKFQGNDEAAAFYNMRILQGSQREEEMDAKLHHYRGVKRQLEGKFKVYDYSQSYDKQPHKYEYLSA